ncbi:hypothetical protein OMAG_001378 [Candidatus Omnitrophus magneticus]|uniref:Uncharacterized protein n=1 Tax=Candidatus Omnitrophus magneticus TaxID=1609969 RepID=A0A0F0CN06_9BACT|nr:hypothetical protein OMAG_002478 [Candidatus Omnitrophus magneticus]KJJ84448.1 hypothetical protein OMAG_001685 [Candidatus Omnitrophus magneticus]KJJ84708.1 hypothetical protein OMAG_001423 [Candidatus Omnitrophus magneticus]KJJ84753.1 hypothetical protein OMAG_001378 [Candidatus Omnitrophus magneticus]
MQVVWKKRGWVLCPSSFFVFTRKTAFVPTIPASQNFLNYIERVTTLLLVIRKHLTFPQQ